MPGHRGSLVSHPCAGTPQSSRSGGVNLPTSVTQSFRRLRSPGVTWLPVSGIGSQLLSRPTTWSLWLWQSNPKGVR